MTRRSGRGRSFPAGARLNTCHNALDRHQAARAAQPALVWISTETDEQRTYTYAELYDEVNQPTAPVSKIEMKPLETPLSNEYALGRILYHSTSDSRISKDGRACASCHPDGRDDGSTNLAASSLKWVSIPLTNVVRMV